VFVKANFGQSAAGGFLQPQINGINQPKIVLAGKLADCWKMFTFGFCGNTVKTVQFLKQMS
jgi:hypothetical protein